MTTPTPDHTPPTEEGKASEEVCKVCTRDKQWHRENQRNVHHPFTPEGGSLAVLGESASDRRRREVEDMRRQTPPGRPLASKPMPPSDPGLRLLMVQKGLVTADDLAQADATLAALRPGQGVVVEQGREQQVFDLGRGHAEQPSRPRKTDGQIVGTEGTAG